MPNTQPLLSIIIVSYNTSDLTVQTLESVVADLHRSQLLAEKSQIIIVDNHSKDDSLAAIRKCFAQLHWSAFHIIENHENLGFAKANNQAIRLYPANYYFLLNSDTIVQKAALEQMLKTFQKYPLNEASANLERNQGKIDRLGILAATLLNQDETLQPQGGSLPSLRTIAAQMFFLDDLPWLGRYFPSTQHTGLSDFAFKTYQRGLSRLIQKDWVGGTAMMIRQEVVEEIGDLDENIFMYGEDQEYCMRAHYHHYDVAIDPQAAIIHLGSASSSSKNAIIGELRGYIYIFHKHMPNWKMPILRIILFLGVQLRIFLYNVLHQPAKAAVYKETAKVLASL
jgi:GT2 family glycosyltransferase